jgi:hypothetical protein
MGLGTFVKSTGMKIQMDEYYVDPNNLVTFHCPNRELTISSLITSPIPLKSQAEWNEPLSSGTVHEALVMLDTILSVGGSTSIKQPWFGRKTYKGSKVFNFTIGVEFVATHNAHADVWLPALGLLSLCYPRKVSRPIRYAYTVNDKNERVLRGYAYNGLKEKERVVKEVPFKGTDADWEKALETKDIKNGILGLYVQPGPNIFQGTSEFTDTSLADNVSVSIGSIIQFDSCYMKQVTLEATNSFNEAGYPNRIKGTVEFETMDIPFAEENGDFMFLSKLSQNNNFTLDGLLEQLMELGERLFQTLGTVYEKGKTTGASYGAASVANK